jgi:uncharacterized SAM-binding protein YcdF (DUF218 family)
LSHRASDSAASTSIDDTQPLPSIAAPRRRRRFRWVVPTLVFLILAVPLLLGSLVGAIYWQARTDEAVRSDAIVVLGAAQWNGRPSDVLQARLDRALELYEEGYAPLIVVTGGKALGDAFTEAETGRNYLVDRGVPASAIIEEDQSRDTWSSLKGVDAALSGTDVHSLLIVSDGFHLFRAEMMARKLGYEVHGSPASDSPIRPWSSTEFSYVIRETGGVLAFLPNYF